MTKQDVVVVELCRSNSIGSRYCEPSVILTREVSREEAIVLREEKLPNGFFWREQRQDVG